MSIIGYSEHNYSNIFNLNTPNDIFDNSNFSHFDNDFLYTLISELSILNLKDILSEEIFQKVKKILYSGRDFKDLNTQIEDYYLKIENNILELDNFIKEKFDEINIYNIVKKYSNDFSITDLYTLILEKLTRYTIIEDIKKKHINELFYTENIINYKKEVLLEILIKLQDDIYFINILDSLKLNNDYTAYILDNIDKFKLENQEKFLHNFLMNNIFNGILIKYIKHIDLRLYLRNNILDMNTLNILCDYLYTNNINGYWYDIQNTQNLTEDLVIEYENFFNIISFSNREDLSIYFIRKYKDIINWETLINIRFFSKSEFIEFYDDIQYAMYKRIYNMS